MIRHAVTLPDQIGRRAPGSDDERNLIRRHGGDVGQYAGEIKRARTRHNGEIVGSAA